MSFLPADYALGGLTLVLAVMGLFRGFSGTLAFLVALCSAGVVGHLCWPYSEEFTDAIWLRTAILLIAILLTFGIVRLVVKKCVNGLLAQPTDSLLGFLVGALIGAFVVVAWAISGIGIENSSVVTLVAGLLQ